MRAKLAAALLLPAVWSTFLAADPAAGIDRWTRVGPDAADVRVLAASPSRPAIVYAGLNTGGVYRSTDAGRTWARASWGLEAIYPVYQLAVSPTAPDTVFAITPLGLFRTHDGGAAWRHLDPDAGSPGVRSMAVHPRDGKVVYALLSDGGARRSTDGGISWTDLPNAPKDAGLLRIDPSHPNVLYASLFDQGGLWKSTDEGWTWARTGHGLEGEARVRELEIDPATPQTLYATLATSDTARGFFRSTDGGETFVPLPPNLGDRALVLLGTASHGTQSTLFGAVDRRLYRSLNGGASWSAAGAGLTLPSLGLGGIAVTSGAVLIPTFEGVFRSANGGRSWAASSRQLKEGRIEGLSRGSALYVGASRQGIYESAGRQGGWRRLPMDTTLTQDFYGPVTADPRRPGRIYASTAQGIARSEDGGNSWEVADTGCLWTEAIVTDPADPETLYVTGNRSANGSCTLTASICGLQKSTDGGRSWTCSRNGLPEEELSHLTVDPRRPSTLLVLAKYDVYRSTDGGGSWSLLAPGGPPKLVFRALAFDPLNANRIYAGVYQGVARSTDGGLSWTPLVWGLPLRDAVLAVAVDPVTSDTLYAMTSASGVFKSTDAGENWAPLGTGLEDLYLEDLLLDPRDRSTLYVRTRTDGLLKLTQGAVP